MPFAAAMRDRLQNGNITFRKAYLRLFIERIEVDDAKVRIMGSNAALVQAVARLESRTGAVPSFMSEWRPKRDSNSQILVP